MKSNFLGLELKNPIIIGAGPWNRNGENLRKGLKTGVGAVITETILSDPREDVRPRIAYNGSGVQNIRLYSEIQVEQWEREIDIAKKDGGILIASISAHTASELAYLADKVERFGADGIEICLSSPMGESFEVASANPQNVFEMTEAASQSVDIPVMVKLSQTTTNISQCAKAVKKGGGQGVSAINTIRGILSVDIDKMEPDLGAYGGYSGEPIRPIALATIATIAQSVDIPICGVGGISTYRHVLEYIMLGAAAVQISTTVLLEGLEKIETIIEDLNKWEEEKNLKSYDEIKGKALNSLRSVGEIKIEPLIAAIAEETCETSCRKCVKACVYEAIKKESDIIMIDIKLDAQVVECVSLYVPMVSLNWDGKKASRHLIKVYFVSCNII